MPGSNIKVTPEQVQEAIERAPEVENSEANGNHKSVEADRRSARRVEILSLRLAGFSVEQIATRVDLTDATVHLIISDTLSNTTNRQVAELRALENDRLDRAQAAIWTAVLEGNLKAIDTFLKLSTQRSKINGLYAATKIDLSVGIRHEMESALVDLEKLMQTQANEIIRGEVVKYGEID